MGAVVSTHMKKGRWQKMSINVDVPDMPAEPEKGGLHHQNSKYQTDAAGDVSGGIILNEQEEKLEKWCEETRESMEYLQSNDDYATEECFKIYDNLRRASTIKPKSNRVTLGDHLISLGFIEIFPRMWNDLNSYQMYVDEPDPKAKQAHANVKRMLGSYWNFSDCSDRICIDFGKLGCLDLLVEGLKNPELSVDRLTDDGKRYVIKGILGIIHNCCRRIPKCRAMCYGAIDSLQELSTSSYLIVRAKAFIVLAYVAKKSETQRFGANDACIKFMLKMIEEALTYKNHVTKKYGFSALETLQGIKQMALNDDNKMLIVNLDGLPLIRRMLDEGCSEEEKEMAASTIWQLAFCDENKEKIRQDQELIRSLMLLKNSENPAIRDACTGSLWEIYDSKVPFGIHNDKSPESSIMGSTMSIESDAPHIMISYQWDSQDRMIEVRDLLQKSGYNVWMDIDKMAGDILGAMAQAVERAAVVLVCMTQRYSESHNGRTEATYAYKLKKPIVPLQLEEGYEGDGWLGALVGTLLYYKMYSDPTVASNLPSLIKEIGDRGRMPKRVSSKHNGILLPQKSIITTAPPPRPELPALPAKVRASSEKVSTTPNPIVSSGSKKGPVAIPVARWSQDQVQKWLVGNNVMHDTLSSLTGEQLVQMRKQLARAPEFFHQTLKEELKLGFLAILNLTAALDKLPV